MELEVLIFLTSGLFLGWTLGANDAANIFGTAVGTGMLRFATAAVICSVFIGLGAVVSGSGAAGTLGRLGAVNALAGAFMAALAAALAVYTMIKAGLSVSTSQAIVGAIVGWSLYSGTLTDTATLAQIMLTWVICPVLAAVISAALLKLTIRVLRRAKIHLLRVDAYTRLGLIFAGAFGAYSLGANNIANVMGVFVTASPFSDISVGGLFTLTSTQQLFLLGAVAIAVGVFTYSRRTMMTIGTRLLPLSPIAAWVAVVSHSIVLFLFASVGLKRLLEAHGLPALPLVPVSSSQAIVGAVFGIAMIQGGRGFRWRIFGAIGLGWIVTPVLAGAICFVGLFFLQNVFNQQTHRDVSYMVSNEVIARLARQGIDIGPLLSLQDNQFDDAVAFHKVLRETSSYNADLRKRVMAAARRDPVSIDREHFPELNRGPLSEARLAVVHDLNGRFFPYEWMLRETLAARSPDWRPRDGDDAYNRILERDFRFVVRLFRID